MTKYVQIFHSDPHCTLSFPFAGKFLKMGFGEETFFKKFLPQELYFLYELIICTLSTVTLPSQVK